ETAYGDSDKGVITDIPSAIGKIVGTLLSFVGVIFLILMIYGGYLWMLARENEEQAKKARNIITNALIGLIIVLAAYAITALAGKAIAGDLSAVPAESVELPTP
ncbi:MAG: hypothetical protein U9R06_00465, partial [Patescibacteria group bacterium]|nr:hypothetical protein [Patescibacteria group bacterium]